MRKIRKFLVKTKDLGFGIFTCTSANYKSNTLDLGSESNVEEQNFNLCENEVQNQVTNILELKVIDASDSEFDTDLEKWNEITETLREYWIAKGPMECQNYDCDFSKLMRYLNRGPL